MRRFVPPVLTTAATAGIVYWSLVTVTAARSVRWIAPLVFGVLAAFSWWCAKVPRLNDQGCGIPCRTCRPVIRV